MDHGRVVSMGSFDGVHAGHAELLREVTAQAKRRSLPRLLLAFIPPCTPDDSHCPAPIRRQLLLPLQVRLALLRRHADEVHRETVDSVRTLTPDRFARDVLVRRLRTRVVVEGESFRFGHGRSGDMETMRSLGEELGFDVISIPPVHTDGEPVSSTRIRRAIEQGDLRLARRCLARPYALFGVVVRGDQLGTQIGYPTANLAVDPLVLLPPHGVYAVHAWAFGRPFDGLLYLGRRPTLGENDLRCEVHLLEPPPQPLYGQHLEAHLLESIRADRAFSSVAELQEKIQLDIDLARRILNQHPREPEPILG